MTFSDNVTVLEKGEKTYYVVGTAHVSPKSVEEVAHVIDEVKPDTVCVELCETRYKTLTQEDQWKKLNIAQVIKQGKALMLLANLALSSFQRKMGEQMGVKPGAELLKGVHKAEEHGAKLVLADREIQTTLKRTWANLSLWKKIMVMSGLFESVLSKDELSEEELEQMKEKDQLSEMMQEFSKALPEVKKPLIDERDQYLMSKIEHAEGKKIVAVVGAGHVSGMQDHFGKEVDLQALDEIPKPSKLVPILKWVLPIIILSLFTVGYFKHRDEALESMLYAWILPNGIFTGLFTLAARGKILSALIGAVAAPITSLNPSIGAGMVVALVEAILRKPTVADCERIPEDIQTMRGFFRNPVTHILVIFVASSVGSMVGTLVGTVYLVKIFTG